MVEASIFRDYDIRGTVPDKLSFETAKLVGNAFARNLFREKNKQCKVAVGRDVRPSSLGLFNNVVQGLLDAGADVLDAGICPSPVLYFSTKITDVDGYIMITGSHNPPEYNGLKLGTNENVYHTDKIQMLYRDILENGYIYSDNKGSMSSDNITEKYIEWSLQHFSELKMKTASFSRKIKVVIDSGNGVASKIAPLLFEKLGAEVIPLFCEEDGTFPNHHPDPTVEKNLSSVFEALKQHSADFAAAYDGDADRIVIVTNSGRVILGDLLLGIFAEEICQKNKNATIIGDVKASKSLYDRLEQLGANAIMWKAGHSMIKDKMIETGALLAGETSAHIFFNDRFFGFDDGIYASLRFFEIYTNKLIAGEITTADDLLKEFPIYYNTPEIRLDFPDSSKFSYIETVRRKIEKTNHKKPVIKSLSNIDGLRVTFDKGWGLIRASNTQPAVVLRFEAIDKITLDEYIQFFEEITELKIV